MKRLYFAMIMAVVVMVVTNAIARDNHQVQPKKPYRWTGFNFGFQGSYHTGNSEWEPEGSNEPCCDGSYLAIGDEMAP